MTKKPFVTKEKLEEIAAAVPTPFHIYDEKGIRENAKAVKEAFSWNRRQRQMCIRDRPDTDQNAG